MKIYNTMSGKKEKFKPANPDKVSMYVCGITAYDDCHLGHARAALVFDVIYRYLSYIGFNVTYVKNFTDIDDKIIDRANKLGVSCSEIAEKYIESYKRDIKELGISEPTHEPKATENIDYIISMVKGLIDKGFAYESGGSVYFRVRHFVGYGKLSKRSIEDMVAGARIEVNQSKEDPMDFALWKKSKQGEPSWESPWGMGRPGWHIECSAMSQRLLGDTIDIHGGGKDLIFPHHENEIAQSEAFTGKPFVRFWIHNGFVTIDEEKMSKSLGNFFTTKDILKEYGADVVRFFLLSTHYRSPLNFSDKQLDEAKRGLKRVNNTIIEIERLVTSGDKKASLEEEHKEYLKDVRSKFENAMSDDFNTAQAIGVLFAFVKDLNIKINKPSEYDLIYFAKGRDLLRELGAVLGLFGDSFNYTSCELDVPKTLTKECMEIIIDLRNNARKNKEWAVADMVRKSLSKLGIILKDKEGVTVWDLESPQENGLLQSLVAVLVEIRENARLSKSWSTADLVRDRLKEIGITLKDRALGETTWEVDTSN